MEYLEETVHANTDTDTDLELRQEIHILKLALSNIQNELSASQEKQKFFHRQCKKNEIKLRNMNAIFDANHRETLEMIIDAFITNGRTALKKYLLKFTFRNSILITLNYSKNLLRTYIILLKS